ncbi:hypothetical protein C8R43DRAFT_457212 [Mycena crocata]|nr:hypothetical protein C8R43DRAFT_457212 [Mycena crocata]
MDSLKRVVKVEKATKDSLNLRRIFGPGHCGEIRALHASGFIEFSDVAGAQRALTLKLDHIPGVRVLDVATQPRLVDQYRVVNPSAFTGVNDMQSNGGVGRPNGIRSEANRAPRDSPNTTMGPADVLPPPDGPSAPETGLFLQALKSSDNPVSHPPGLQTDGRKRAISGPVISPPSLPLPHSFAATLPLPANSSSAANPLSCMESRILMRLCGENITLDLRSLAGDPATVIELLKVTASERGNWLIVSAYYRRTGNPGGAKAVVTAMLEALTQFNIPENDLKPAFLLLSGCEIDLGKIARSKAEPEKVAEHYSNAQKWLHKVYGACPPSLVSELPTVEDSKRSPPRAPASLRSRIDATSAPSAPRSHPPSPNHRMLEREIQSLRDRHTHNNNIISDMRLSKRKLEDTVEMERDVRRRLQRELDQVVKERDKARRMETITLDQMKREVDSRRRAEDRADEERELRKRAESSADFAMLQRQAYVGVPRMTPMVPQIDRRSPESYSAFEHRISF